MARYTYDEYQIFRDGTGYCGGQGVTSKRSQLTLFERLKDWNPQDIHIVIRRPDNKILAFYHPDICRSGGKPT